MTTGPEFNQVEKPFLDQLAALGWRVITGNLDFPSATGRSSFREVLLKNDLAKALRRVNLRDGEPWLDDARISQAVSALERIAAKRLMEANQKATELLLKGPAQLRPHRLHRHPDHHGRQEAHPRHLR
ncbi:MAG: hypothetical protein GY856_01315 [bacterium]|nr:hypothetical protein [bacterium]